MENADIADCGDDQGGNPSFTPGPILICGQNVSSYKSSILASVS